LCSNIREKLLRILRTLFPSLVIERLANLERKKTLKNLKFKTKLSFDAISAFAIIDVMKPT